MRCGQTFAFNSIVPCPMRSLQPEDDPGLCVEAANLQPPVQHQAVHHRPGEALPADVGAPFVWEEAGSPHQLPPNREQPECLNFKPHIPPPTHPTSSPTHYGFTPSHIPECLWFPPPRHLLKWILLVEEPHVSLCAIASHSRSWARWRSWACKLFWDS